MAGSSLFMLIDDIAALLDDIALMTKVAARKTAGVLGDDLALNAQQVTGVSADRELPVVWAVAKGSLRNKAILVPSAMVISYFTPWAITPLLMAGGAYLCFEGAEKIFHSLLVKHKTAPAQAALTLATLNDPEINLVAYERDKISGAIRTDFILSAEIITITLGTVVAQNLLTQAAVLSLIALVMTIGVYGIVAGLVKLDDLGLYLYQRPNARKFQQSLGRMLLNAAPWLMKFLSVAGTVAMFLVGGGILAHGLAPLHHVFAHWTDLLLLGPALWAWTGLVSNAILQGLTGFAAGALLVALGHLVKRLRLSRAH